MRVYVLIHGGGGAASNWVATRYLLCRDDRMFPATVTRRVVRERLHIEPNERDGGHCPFLSRPAISPTASFAYAGDHS